MLRSMRYGEADRILHLYTPRRGRVSAIAKGVRRARSRFGGRLEPFFRLQLDLHEGRGELLTITGAQTVEAYPRLRSDARALDAAARACDAVGRLFETDEPHPGVYNLLCRRLALLDEHAGARVLPPGRDGEAGGDGVSRVEGGRSASSGRAGALAFRLKLMLAAGLAPQLAACVSCGEREQLAGFSGSAGGVVCGACWPNTSGDQTRSVAGFALAPDAYAFMIEALGAPLADTPDAAERALVQVERAVGETLEHHANVRLMPAA